MAIQALPETVQSFIRSGITIPSPAQAVEELILNSLDAGASSISVHFDFKYYKIQVTDNGCGMSSNELEAVGDRYMTSKCHSLEDLRGNLKYFGYRGEALAAIREISGVLSIISRVKGQNEVFCKLFVQGKSNKVEIYDLQPHDVGTTVTIQDFMFNLPVRRTSIRDALEIEEIRACVESIAIIHPQVSFNVHNDSKGTVVFQKHINSDILTSFTHIFGQLTAQSLAPINFSNGKFRISGFIGKYPSRHKNLQFLYVNKRSLRKTKIHTLINNMLAKSSILRGNGPNRFKPIPEAMNAKSLMSFTKLERNKKFAVFIVQIQCNIRDYEISFDPKKTSIFFQDWSSLSNAIELCIRDFLKRENLVLSEVPVSQISKTSTHCDALKELEELDNETLTEDNISSNCQTFDEFPLTHYLPRAVHGLPAKRKKQKEKSFPVSKNLRSKINPSLFTLDCKRAYINDKIEGIYSETTDENSSYFLSSFKSNSDLEKCSGRNNRLKCADQTSINKSETINVCLGASTSSEFPFTHSGKQMNKSGDEKITYVRKEGYNRFYNLRKFAANNDRKKKKKLTPVNQNEDEQKKLTSHHTDYFPSDVSKVDSRNNSVILSNKDSSTVDSVDVSFKFSPRVNLQMKEAYGEEKLLSQCEIKLNKSLGSKNKNLIVSLKEKSILTADDFIHTLDKEKITKRCKCKDKYTKSSDFNHSTEKISEVNLPLVGVKFDNTIVSENFQDKEGYILPKRIKELNDSYFQSKLDSDFKTKNYYSQFEEINKYGVKFEAYKNKFGKSSPIIASPYFCYEQGKRIAEDIGKEVGNELKGDGNDNYSEINFSTISYCKNKEVQDLTSDYKSSDEDEEYSSLKNIPCLMESMKNTNFDFYNSKSNHTDMFDNVQIDQSRNSILNFKEIDSSLCGEENSINYSPDVYKATDFSNTVQNVKNNTVKRIIKQVSHKQPLAVGDKIYDSEKEHNTESVFVVSQSDTCEQLQLNSNKQIEEVVLKSNEFIKSPYFRNTQEDNERLSTNELVENEAKECEDGMSSDGDRGSSIEDDLNNISDIIRDENEVVINIGESNQNSSIDCSCEVSDDTKFQIKALDYDMKGKIPARKNSYSEHHGEGTSSASEKVRYNELYSMEDRFTFLPKGISPILQYKHCAKKVLNPDVCQKLQMDLLNEEGKDEDTRTVKWQKIFGSECSGSKALIKKLCVEAEDGLKRTGNIVKDGYDKKLLKLAEKVSEIMKPFHYTKTIFLNYKLVGQCDRKFIIICCSFVEGKEPHVIGAFDQHAVHERIRVEALLKEYIQDDGNIFKASDLDCELSVTLSGKEFRIVIGYKSEFERLGLQFEIEDENRIKLIRVPTCLYNRYLRVTSRRLTVLKDLLQKLITDHVEFLLKTRGIGFGIPDVLLDVINSEACRGAIKFGDLLSEEECTQMLSDLAYCNKPFYCAHGRPTFCPIFDMNELHTKRPIIFNKLKPRC